MSFKAFVCCSALVLSITTPGCLASSDSGDEPKDEEVAGAEQAVTSYEYVGCFPTLSSLGGTVTLNTLLASSNQSHATCQALADPSQYPYIGLQWYGQCWAGSSPGSTPMRQVAESYCNTPCDVNHSEMCGGGYYNSVYARKPRGNRTPLGCYADDANARILPDLLIQSGATVESCQQVARQRGYGYFGVQYYGQCWAGYQRPSSGPVSPSYCNTLCDTNPTEMCGGGYYDSLYQLNN